MRLILSSAKLSGKIAAIPSKSHAQRVLIAAALADKPTEVRLNADADSLSDDLHDTVMALTAMGARPILKERKIVVAPCQHARSAKQNPTVNCGESGTAARLLLPVLCALFDSGTLTGEGSLLKRPFATLCKALEPHGVHFDRHELPISWEGSLQSGQFELPGDESSQYLSGLLFALPLLDGISTITLTTPLESAGYVDITMDVLRQFGVDTEAGCPQTYRSPGSITVEGDWSNAAFWLAAGVKVTGLNPDSFQRDRSFVEVKDWSVIDATDIPDLVPILSVLAAKRKGITRINGIKRLRIKESDRIATTVAMLRALGCEAEASDDELTITGTGSIPGGGTVDGANDHRIVMAASIAACFSEQPVTIRGAQAVAKTYPSFFEDYQHLGGGVHVI